VVVEFREKAVYGEAVVRSGVFTLRLWGLWMGMGLGTVDCGWEMIRRWMVGRGIKEWYEYRREEVGQNNEVLSCYSITLALALALVIQI